MMNFTADSGKNIKIHLSSFPTPRAVEVNIMGAPDFLHPVRALFMSDIHLRRSVSDESFDRLIDLIKEQNADLLLLGGDYGEGKDQCVRFFKALADISFRFGAYAVPGNNDRFDDLHEIAKLGNICLLKNSARDISLNGGTVRVGGSDDNMHGEPDTRDLFPRVDSYRILLSHFPTAPECDCDLQLSGHTHGGQINLFGITAYSFGFEHSYHIKALRGLTQVNGHPLLVGNGIGISKFPIRIGAEPEIYLLHFQ